METCDCVDLGYKENMTWDELIILVETKDTCTSPWYLCPTVDRLLRKADAERTRQNYYTKKKKREGYSDKEIRSKPKGVTREEVDINAIL